MTVTDSPATSAASNGDSCTDRRVSAMQLDALLSSDPSVRLLDVRTSGEFEAGHIAGAHNVPLDLLADHVRAVATTDANVVLICQSGARAAKAEEALAGAGMCNLKVLDGGMNSWMASGRPVEIAKERWSLERQVRLVAGSIVLTSILASLKWPKARFLAGGIGAGLTFAAVSNTCAMGMMLAKLPYNRGAQCDIDAVVRELRAGAGQDQRSAA
ncbi:MAG: rhodanese-like domain-containing protein [Ilumatobacteraceae bacterium]|jgi:rhodanese-related sulfurtransferase|nr:rhodanese-like domain-containing protein [Ilumatobacteraceae bacterium]